jgi:acetyl-CoA C-acetyltransferase
MIEASASIGVAPAADLEAPIVAARMLAEKPRATPIKEQHAIELAELSAAQAIAFKAALGLDDEMLNSNGGQIARGHPAGASSAVLAVRLFTRLVRDEGAALGGRGVAVSGAFGGQALAVQFRRV